MEAQTVLNTGTEIAICLRKYKALLIWHYLTEVYLEFSRKISFRFLLCDVISATNLLHVVTQNFGWPTSYLLLIDYV